MENKQRERDRSRSFFWEGGWGLGFFFNFISLHFYPLCLNDFRVIILTVRN